MSKKRKIFNWVIFGLAIAINVFILVNAFLDGATSSKESDGFSHAAADVINSISADTITKENFPAFAGFNRKLFGHFLLFVLSGLTTTFSIHNFIKHPKFGKSYLILAFSMAFGVVFATLSELAQFVTDGRVFAFTDILIDSGGYLLGNLIIFIILFVSERKKQKNPELQWNYQQFLVKTQKL